MDSPAAPPPAAQVTSTRPPTPTPQRTTAPAPKPPPPPPCRNTDLELSQGAFRQIEFGADGALVTAGKDFRLTNTGAEPCVLQGWVRITVIGVDGIVICPGYKDPTCGKQIDTTSVNDVSNVKLPGNSAPVTLAPGQQTIFTATWQHCVMRGWEIQVRVPGDETPIVDPAGHIPACKGTTLSITPIGTQL